jgi:hypothetical protein
MTLSLTIAAAALIASAPAWAQNASAPGNTADNTVATTTNEVAGTTTTTTNTMTAAETATVPVDENATTVDTGYAAPAQEEKKSFPWGVLGLLGLLGLIPRTRRGR